MNRSTTDTVKSENKFNKSEILIRISDNFKHTKGRA